MRLYVGPPFAGTMKGLFRRRSDKDSSYEAFLMATEPWNDLLRELRGERGFLLGSEEYREMDPVDRLKALKSIDELIREATEWISYYRGVEKRA